MRRPLVEIYVGHRVVDAFPSSNAGPDANTSISTRHLENFLAAQKGRPALSLADLETLRIAPEGRLPYMMTFDDGFRDFATTALPLLEAYHVPALLFVTTGWIGGRDAPYEYVLAELIEHAAGELELGRSIFPTRSKVERQSIYERLRQSVKSSSSRQREALLRRVADAVGIPPQELLIPPTLTEQELQALDRHELVTIGAHSVEHLALRACGPARVWGEIRGSMDTLERILSRPVTAFSYPYGQSTVVVRAIARLAGVKWGFTTRSAVATDLSVGGRLRLPRRDLKEWTPCP